MKGWDRSSILRIMQTTFLLLACLFFAACSNNDQHAALAKQNHERRLEWQRAHPREYAAQRAAAKAKALAEQKRREEQKREAAVAARRRAEAEREQAAAAERAREAAAVRLNITGSGIHTTETFNVNDEWALGWSYNCTGFSDGTGNFIVNVNGIDAAGVNELGSSGSGVEHYHEGGNGYLVINSECNWAVKVVSE